MLAGLLLVGITAPVVHLGNKAQAKWNVEEAARVESRLELKRIQREGEAWDRYMENRDTVESVVSGRCHSVRGHYRNGSYVSAHMRGCR